MQTYQSILIANEELAGLEVALAKAAQLERYSGAELTLLEAIYDNLEKEPDSVLPFEEKEMLRTAYLSAEKNALNHLANELQNRVASLKVATVWSEDRGIGICRYAERHSIGLVVKPHTGPGDRWNRLSERSDWRLMSDAHCPILFSRVPSWDDNHAVIACVDVLDTAHNNLNLQILQESCKLSTLFDVPLHFLIVGAAPELSLGRFSSTIDVLHMREKMMRVREAELEKLRSQAEGMGVSAHVEVTTGKLLKVTEELAVELGAQVIVMGTSARSGLARIVPGNSAEKLLRNLDRDLYCVHL